MSVIDYRKAPFPYFGGKQHAAETVWAALGDVTHYVEPFAGSLAVLLRRPHLANRTYYSETVNDIDGLLVNMWRALLFDPDGLAEAVSWPITEIDLTARHLALVRWKAEHDIHRMLADPEWYDLKMAGYWLYGICAWIGSGWCSGDGPWIVGPHGGIMRRPPDQREPGVSRQLPHLSDSGKGVHRPQLREPGVRQKLPHVSDNGRGVHHGTLREPGVSRQLPHMSDNGQGVHHGNLREPGVSRRLPHLSSNGQGINHGNLREPGVSRRLPHLSNDGRGVHRPQLREPGVERKRPHLTNSGQGVHRPQLREPGVEDGHDWHPMTMPELRNWLRYLSARLRHVRIINGDWRRVVTQGALKTIDVRMHDGVCGVFLDPPYDGEVRNDGLYTHDHPSIATDVRQWCIENGDDPQLRIVLCGFAGEGHEELERHGWRCVKWYQPGYLRGGMANQGERGTQQHRERLWLSPHCLRTDRLPMDDWW